MAIIDFLKRKKSKPEKKEESVEAKKEQAEVQKKTQKKEKEKVKKTKEKKSEIAWKVLKAPQITEKSTNLSEKNQYTFKVWPKANKVEIKKAIEDLYDVEVLSVKIINVKNKKRRLGRILGKKSGYKKAIVKIKEGQKIEVLPR